MPGEQARNNAAPPVGGVAVAVDEENGRPFAGVRHIRAHAVDVEHAVRKLVAARVVESRVSNVA
jgi:hypothetical protein